MPPKVYDKTYTSLPLWCSRDESQGAYIFGVTISGVDVPLVARKLGGIDSDLVDVQQAAADAAAAQQAQPAAEPVQPADAPPSDQQQQ